ncbi:MAG: hypothetical protein WBN89_10920 [Prochlorococcaceae cyanobacterium]
MKREIAVGLPQIPYQSYCFSSTNFYLGWHLQGAYTLRKLALLRVGEVEYEYIDEKAWSQCEIELHDPSDRDRLREHHP